MSGRGIIAVYQTLVNIPLEELEVSFVWFPPGSEDVTEEGDETYYKIN